MADRTVLSRIKIAAVAQAATEKFYESGTLVITESTWGTGELIQKYTYCVINWQMRTNERNKSVNFLWAWAAVFYLLDYITLREISKQIFDHIFD